MLYALLPQTIGTGYIDALTALFKTQKGRPAQKAIAATLPFACSCKGDAFLKSLATGRTVSKRTRKYATKTTEESKLGKEDTEPMKVMDGDDTNPVSSDA